MDRSGLPTMHGAVCSSGQTWYLLLCLHLDGLRHQRRSRILAYVSEVEVMELIDIAVLVIIAHAVNFFCFIIIAIHIDKIKNKLDNR